MLSKAEAEERLRGYGEGWRLSPITTEREALETALALWEVAEAAKATPHQHLNAMLMVGCPNPAIHAEAISVEFDEHDCPLCAALAVLEPSETEP